MVFNCKICQYLLTFIYYSLKSYEISLFYVYFLFADINCYAPDNSVGNCMNYRYCDYIIQLINGYNQNPIAYESILRRSICGYDGADLLVCCPSISFTTTTSSQFYFTFFGAGNSGSNGNPITLPPPPQAPPRLPPPSAPPTLRFALQSNDASKCGMSNGTHAKVVGGANAQLNAWPWMSILGYRANYDQSTRFQCGGSLITQQHVLTAGHCIKDSLILIRLGDYNINSDADGANPIDVGIQWKKTHENFDPNRILNDIGLIKLVSLVQITIGIRPICLPILEPLRSKDLTYHQPFVIGYGATSYKGSLASILQESQVPIVPLTQCATSYQTIYPGQVFDDRVLCAGYAAGGKDACQGDSGSPLMYPTVSILHIKHKFNFKNIKCILYFY